MDILIEELDGGLWVAALQKGRLQGLEVDPEAEEVRWGSIYYAKVARIDAALDAAYVNLDGQNIGILHNADVRTRKKDGKYEKQGNKAIGKTLQPGQMVAVQAKNGFIASDEEPYSKAGAGKCPRMSMNIVLPGRYLIYAPMENENRVSRRIKDKTLREQLMTMLGSVSSFEGCILRAAAAGAQTDVLVREAKIHHEAWEQIQQYFEGDNPQLIMEGPDAFQRMVSDHADKRIENLEITTMEHYQDTEEWCEVYAPDLVTKIHPVELPDPSLELGLFDMHDIVSQIDELFQPYAILPGGSTIIIQETAAVMVVDVNSGADARSKLAINIDAAREIARQVRLRNVGGAMIIDFLRMNDTKDREQLQKELEQAVNDDPCTVQVHGFTNMGLMEMTRHRRTPSLADRFEAAME